LRARGRPSSISAAFTPTRNFGRRLTPRIQDPAIAQFWLREFPSYDQRFQAEAVAPILNKVGQITASPTLRNILGQTSPKFDLAQSMNRGGIVHR